MIGVDVGVHIKKVPAFATNDPHDATVFQLKSSLIFPIGERSKAELNDRAYQPIRLTFLPRATEATCSGIAVHVERAGAVFNGVPLVKYEKGGRIRSVRRSPTMAFVSGVKSETAPCSGGPQ